jgi:hypothetical protein
MFTKMMATITAARMISTVGMFCRTGGILAGGGGVGDEGSGGGGSSDGDLDIQLIQ